MLHTFDRLILDASQRADGVHGVAAGGPISLINAKVLSSDVPLLRDEFIRQSIGCDYVLLGRHTDTSDVGRRFLLRFTNLHRLTPEVWKPLHDDNARSAAYELSYRFTTATHLARAEHAGLKVDLYADSSASLNYGIETAFSVQPVIDVVVEFDHSASAAELRQARLDLGLLWSLLTGVGSEVIGALASIHGRAPDRPLVDEDDETLSQALIGTCGPHAQDVTCIGDLLYDLARGPLPGALATVLQSWLVQRDFLRVAAQLLLDTWNEKVGWESRLGIVAQALEAYHRVSPSPKTFVSETDYATVAADLMSRIAGVTNDEDLRVSLKKRLEFGNQVSLRRRTKDLVRALPASLRGVFGKKWQSAVDLMVDTRNRIIHRDPSAPVPDFHDCVRVTGLFCLTVHVSLLRMIGVPDDFIEDRLTTQAPYQDMLARTRGRSA
jgi:hypothetical protein